MLAIHGFWNADHGLCVWAEDSGRTVKSASQSLRSARAHPFAAPADGLAEIHPGKPAPATLLLPSLRSAPLDSPELVRVVPRPAPAKGPTLLAWSVPVVRFEPAAALVVLGQLHDEVRYGASMRFLSDLAEFARELTERGRVLPSVDHVSDTYVARWRPVLQGPDIVSMQALIAAMPPVCRAETDAPANTHGRDAADLASEALCALVDAAVRERLAMSGHTVSDVLPPRRGRRPKRTPVAEAWIQALTTADGRFDAEPDAMEAFEQVLAPWAGFGVGQTGPARLTFRLAEVSDAEVATESRWELQFLLQSVEDPSLLVPAAQVWTGGDGLSRWMDHADELLLAELGRASSIYPELSPAMRSARPGALTLDAEGVYDFLTKRAGVLDQAGFGVLVPSWWSNRRELGLTASATPQEQGGVTAGILSREALCEFEWQLAIGDEPLTEEELAALVAAKAPLVQIRGQWVAVDPEQLRRGLEFLRRQAEGPQQATVAEIIGLATAHPDDLDTALPVTSVEAEGWLGELLSGTLDRSLEPVDLPDTFRATLRPYQQRGLSWLAFLSGLDIGACLADDMGLGKTVQMLALESVRRDANPDTAPTLLLCPMSLVGNWQREAATFAPTLRIYAHHGRERLRGDDLDERLADADMVVTTYQTAARDIDELADRTWERVVLDEAQAIKNSLSRSAKAVGRLNAAQKIALTGTPLENRLSELWSVMDFLNPGILGTPELFRSRYAKPIESYGRTEPAQRLRTVTRPYVLRRLKTDKDIIDDLPDKIEIKQYCRLTTEQASLYQSVVDEMMGKIESTDGIERRGNVLAAMAKLKQVCNHPAQLMHDGSPVGRRSGKVIRLDEILDEILAEGDKVLCFTQFTEFAELLLPHLSARFDQEVLYLHGGTPKKRRDEMVQRFQAGGSGPAGPSIFLLSLKAGGTGLNLTAANHVVHLDRWWNPAVEDQATDRAFRIGQKRNVQVRKFICTGTLEEKIDDMIEKKKALADLVISDGEQWLTELSTGALRDVFALSEEAVDE